jgi:alpha-L-glutamate ligase-like protein
MRHNWQDVLGMNARMVQYIARVNPRQAIRLANNKLATKRALQKAGLATPRLFGIIRNRSELKNFRWTKLPASFVLKPNASSGGGGIIVIFGRNKKGNWVKADKSEIFIPELFSHVLDILDGNFSKSNIPDTAFFEQRVKVHADLKPYSVKGVPDIRILMYNFVPVMAMLRLPTEESGGRANLHAGGIGVGIDLATGATTTAITRGHIIDMLPSTRLRLAGLTIPFWDDILLTATRTAEVAGLRYAGVDVAIDREDGPLVLEINARPGLDIQFANMAPLKNRLRRVEGLSVTKPEKRISLAKHLFGAEGEELAGPAMSSKPILGIEESVTILDSEGHPHIVQAKVDTGAYRTTIDHALAQTLHLHEPVIEYIGVRGALGKQTRPVVDVSMKVRGRTIKTQAFIVDRSHMNFEMILGRRDLKGFLVDPTKQTSKGLK